MSTHRAIEYDNRTDALARTEQEATNRGCRGVTKYWWPLYDKEQKSYLLIGDDDVPEETVTIEIEEEVFRE